MRGQPRRTSSGAMGGGGEEFSGECVDARTYRLTGLFPISFEQRFLKKGGCRFVSSAAFRNRRFHLYLLALPGEPCIVYIFLQYEPLAWKWFVQLGFYGGVPGGAHHRGAPPPPIPPRRTRPVRLHHRPGTAAAPSLSTGKGTNVETERRTVPPGASRQSPERPEQRPEQREWTPGTGSGDSGPSAGACPAPRGDPLRPN